MAPRFSDAILFKFDKCRYLNHACYFTLNVNAIYLNELLALFSFDHCFTLHTSMCTWSFLCPCAYLLLQICCTFILNRTTSSIVVLCPPCIMVMWPIHSCVIGLTLVHVYLDWMLCALLFVWLLCFDSHLFMLCMLHSICLICVSPRLVTSCCVHMLLHNL